MTVFPTVPGINRERTQSVNSPSHLARLHDSWVLINKITSNQVEFTHG